jgi:hypothetical protein
MPRANALRWLSVALLLGLAAAAIVAGLGRRPGPAGWSGDENFGYRPDPQGVERFLAELPQPLFRGLHELGMGSRNLDSSVGRLGDGTTRGASVVPEHGGDLWRIQGRGSRKVR